MAEISESPFGGYRRFNSCREPWNLDTSYVHVGKGIVQPGYPINEDQGLSGLAHKA